MSGAATGDGRLELDDHGEVVDATRPRPVLIDLGGPDGATETAPGAPSSRRSHGELSRRRGHLGTAVVVTAVCLVAAAGLVRSAQTATYSTPPAPAAGASHDDSWTREDVSGPRRPAERGRPSAATFRDPATGAVVMAYSPRS